MPGKTKKPLYIAKNLTDLNAKTSTERVKEGQCRMFAISSEKVYKNAEDSDLLADEERAYVLYMKFLNIIQAVRKTVEYKKNKPYYDKMIGMKKMTTALEQAEVLSQSLQDRYDEMEAVEVSARLEKLSNESEQKLIVEEEIISNDENGDTEKNAKIEEDKNEKAGFITCEKLYTLMTATDEDTSFLIMDVRPSEQYDVSRINYKHYINVPQDIVPAGCTVPHIQGKLPKDSVEEWERRGLVDFIILLDWTCKDSALKTGSPLCSLKDAIYKWDQDTVIKSEPLCLEGGYEEWLAMYPTLSTNSNIPRPPAYSTIMSNVVSLDKIDYDLDLNFLKTPEQLAAEENLKNQALRMPQNGPLPVEQNSNKIPNIPDRNTKPNNSIINSVPKSNLANIEIIKNDFNKPKATSLSDFGRKFQPDSTKIPTKDINIFNDREAMKSEPKPIPTFDRSSKPKPESNFENNLPNGNVTHPVIENRSISTKPLDITQSSDQILSQSEKVVAKTEAEVNELHQQHEVKQHQFEAAKTENKRLALETEARRAKLEAEKKKYEQVNELRSKAEHETAEAMRKKQSIQDEIEQLEKEKHKRLEEEKQRAQEVEQIKHEEEKKKEKLKHETERLREERKRKESEALKKQKEEQEHLANEERISQERARHEEQQRRLREEQEQKARASAALQAQQAREEQQRIELIRQENEATENARRLREEQERKSAAAAAAAAAATKTNVREQMLPVGWEKRYDSTTQKCYYLNHHTKKTQWEFPSIKKDASGAYKAKLKTEEEQSSMGGGLKRSHSSPNIAKLMQDEDQKPAQPFVSREIKPQPQSVRSLELQKDRSILEAKVRDFNPIWGSVGHGLTGLRNQGNTCYMNSTLQCMSNTAFLTTYILTDNYRHDINVQNKLGTRGEIAEEFAAVVRAMWSGQYRSITPRDFKLACARQSDTFAGYDQQDAQELVAYLLDWLHEDLNKIQNRRTIPEQNNDDMPDDVAAQKAWTMYKSVNDSVIGQLFQGQIKSTVMCRVCDKKSVTFDTYYDLSVDIPSQSRCTLKDCLLSWSKEEKMTGDSKWKCPRCKVYREATKRIVIWRLPPILIIVLKRFNHTGMWRQKNSAYVDFPIDNVDFNKYISGPTTIKKNYNLYAVSNHYGTMEGGHYTACCKNPKLDRWFKFDDHEVSEYSKSDIKTSAAYFLFYTSM